MPLVQFEPDYKRMLARYKQKTNADTLKALHAIDEISKRLAAKDLKSKDRDAYVNKLNDKLKKLKTVIKEDLKMRDEDWAELIKNPPKGFVEQAATRTWQTIRREILALQRKILEYGQRGGKEPPPPKLPDLHFGARYKHLIVEGGVNLSPSVLAALEKVDKNSDAAKAIELIGAARAPLEKQITSYIAEAGKISEPKEKARWTKLIKELSELRKELEEFENRIFLIHRLKG
ncbi:MAG TPA: hypothetical protein VGM54_12975 [Chthoniobacter sp.]|jgi:hypothetical protein